jgi:hypothetical protein
LARPADIDELSIPLDKHAQAIGLEPLISQGMLRGQILSEVLERYANFRDVDLMLAAKGTQDMSFHQIHEG